VDFLNVTRKIPYGCGTEEQAIACLHDQVEVMMNVNNKPVGKLIFVKLGSQFSKAFLAGRNVSCPLQQKNVS
jgi:hypothetical protein